MSTNLSSPNMRPKRELHHEDDDDDHRKRAKRKGGKACVYCRRSHMVCEGGRPCERCIKRDIAHLCRDVTPPPAPKKQPTPPYDTASSWPLLPDSSDIDFESAGRNGFEDSEFGILSDMLKTLRVPTLPGGFVDVLSQVVRRGNDVTPAPIVSADNNSKGKTKANPLNSMSRIEQYLLAAADQPDGSRASRLTQVIRAKYEAGLLKPYDYIKGYERMNRWMDSGGRAVVSAAGSRATSPTRFVPPSGSSISKESRRRILAALEVFRPKFRRIARELTDLDLVFVEEANERLMLQYDRALASIHTPSCIWRRTGEIQKANQEFAKLTGIPAPLFRNGQLCVYELMDEDSAVRYWEGYGKVASETGQSHMYTHCTLKIPISLTRPRGTVSTPASIGINPAVTVPDLVMPNSSLPLNSDVEEYRIIKTCFSVTIRRDRYEIPVAIMGQWIPIL